MTVDIPRELVEQFARGNGVIFVGAGLSQGAGLPGWADLVRELAAELEGCPLDTDYRDIAQYYEIEHSRNRLVQKLRDRLDTLPVQPTPVHEALVKLPVSAMFTTNYDDLLEQALRATKRPFAPVVSNVDAGFWSADRVQLVKLHGDLNQPESIVITAEDYERFTAQRPALARLLATILQTHTVLFLGYSATDPDLRLILTQVRDESGRLARNLYTVQFDASPLTAKDLERRGLRVVDLGAQSDVASRNATLCEWLQALDRQAVAEAKKLKPVIPQEPQTVAEVLTAEIQIWLNAMGYTVISRPFDEHCIDLDATLQHGLEEQHVLVRCIAGEITVGHLEALEQDTAAHNIPKGWAVSDRRLPPSARTYADMHPSVRSFSLADFVSQIFGPYFDRLRQLVEESDIPRYYVDLACYRRVLDKGGNEIDRDPYEVIDTYVDDWLKARDANHLSILGEFGSGKTWFCRHYAYRQLKRYLADPVRERLPILITLRDYVKQVEVGSLIRKLLDEQGVRLGGGLGAFEELNRRGKLLLIFDGFDEMAVRVDYQMVVDYFWELAEVVVPGSKALLTCRTGYFRYATEAEKVMHGEEVGRQMIVVQPPKFEVIYLEPFTDEQIRDVVTRRRGPEAAQTILGNPDLAGLARQPMLIEMLMEALPDIQAGTPINKSEVYRLAVDRWLERDIGTGRTFMDKWDKLFFMMELAWEMVSTGNLKIHYKELPKRISRYFGLEQPDEKDHYDYDIRTKSFLRRDAAGHYEFAHKSLAEYFVALKFALELGVAAPRYMAGIPLEEQLPPLTLTELKQTFGARPLVRMPEVRDFLGEIVGDFSCLWAVIEGTKEQRFEDVEDIGGNAATLLCDAGESFAYRDLAGSLLIRADFSEQDLTGSNFHRAILNDSSFEGANLANVTMTRAHLIGASFRNACLAGTDFRGANLYGADFREADIAQASFSGAKLEAVSSTSPIQVQQDHSAGFLDQIRHEIRNQLAARETVREVSIFGSWADGSNDEFSDIDLLVIGDIDKFELRGILRDIEKRFDCEIDELLWSSRQLAESGPPFVVRVLDKPMLSVFRRE